MAAVIKHLTALRDASAPLTVVTIRGVFVATILRMEPAIFDKIAKDGSRFRCSDSFLWKWLHETLNWSERKATRPGHKMPENWEEVCEKAILRMAYSIKEEDIPSSLIVNSDQTQVVYAQGSNLSWAPTSAKQVSGVGEDEKRAFTVMVSVSNNGTLLPFQAIYQGHSKASLPQPSAPGYTNAQLAGFRFESSESKTYWSTQKTMRTFVSEILVPYCHVEKEKLGLPPTQKSIWRIDVWSVHRSAEFRGWMKTNHPNIILHFVPGGCTGVMQPCDVGIQRILKHSFKRSYHSDIVDEILVQIDHQSQSITIDKKLGLMRNRSVQWLLNAYGAVNHPDIVKKVRMQCPPGVPVPSTA